MFRLNDRIPVDFDLFRHENERTAALTHLDHAAEGDVIVYDRGYFSFAMALAHWHCRSHLVFRIARNTNPTFDAFIASPETERILSLEPPREGPPGPSLPIRLARYAITDSEHCLATSLLDTVRYPIQALSDLYHGRWGIEELYKTSKAVIEHFHAKSECGVRQELYAAFTLVTLTRQFVNSCDSDLNSADCEDLPAMRANFKNGLRLVGREIEAIFLRQSEMVNQSVRRIMAGLSQCIQRERPGRNYKREAKQPRSKWLRRSTA